MHNEIIQKCRLSKEDILELGWTSIFNQYDELQFEDMILVTSHFFSFKEAGQLIVDYCMQTKNKHHLKDGFEFMSLYGYEAKAQQLYTEYQYDQELVSHIAVYQLAYHSRMKNTEYLETMKQAKYLYETIDNRALLLKLDLIMLYEQTINKQPIAASIYDTLISKLRELESGYLKTCLLTRLLSLYSYSLFYYEGRLEEAEANCLANCVNPLAPPIFKASARHILGLIYSLTNMEASLDSLEKASELYLEAGYSRAAQAVKRNDIPFVLNIHNQALEAHIELNLVDEDEQAHYFLLQFEYKKAKDILESRLKQHPDHFIAQLYLAYAERDSSLLNKLAVNRNAQEKRLITHFAKKLI
ncbi:hypothetical protein JOC54_002438 [Alkalihalobacillus xiaoxiensis]|uniref:Tetratricopeptide repeat protein n=1 Tax=Shouchella xiaoxiensis TaxID=766895 RepID=A0ABS2SUJ3_9BACI|nr:AimR family lysis-lysogeny pheromone receptor [Shouchella xiaoxiensis]MBM7839167.1 hypothetical protein [Shouchella xiaoxiensis]